MKKTIMTMVAALALVGCSQDQLMPDNPVVQNKGAVGANIFVPATSRGTALNSVDDLIASNNGFDLFAYSYDADGNATPFMGSDSEGIEFAYDDTYKAWDYADRKQMMFWQDVPDDAESMKFFAVSPTAADDKLPTGTALAIGGGEDDNSQNIIYTVPETVTDQVDLMYAQTNLSDPDEWSSTSNAYLNGVSLNFHHALSQIVFQARIAEKEDTDDNGTSDHVTATINSITVRNVAGSGKFNMTKAAGILANLHIEDEDGVLDDKKNNEDYDYNLWDISAGNKESKYALSSTDHLTNYEDIDWIEPATLTDGEDNATALMLIPQELTPLNLENLGNSVNQQQYETLSDQSGACFEISCQVKFTDNIGVEEYIVGSEDGYENIYIPITTGAWNPGYKYIYTLIFSADSGDPVKATVVSVDVWNSYWEDAPNSGDNDDDDDADDDDDEEEGQARSLADYFIVRQSNDRYFLEIPDEHHLKLMRDLINAGDWFYAEQLQELGSGVSATSEDGWQTKMLFSEANYIQIDNVDLSEEGNWVPIKTFSGEYKVEDGETYTISNLTITSGQEIENSDETYGALFGTLAGSGRLQGIHLTNCHISNVNNAAGIVYYIENDSDEPCEVWNCTVGTAGGNDAITANTDIAATCSGGICGQNYGGIIKGCTNYAAVSGYNVGGVVASNDANGCIEECDNHGDVSGKNQAGGVLGSDGSGKIIYCHNYGKVTSQECETPGGIVCWANGSKITACHNEGEVSTYAPIAQSPGGIVGNIQYLNTNSIHIIGCYNVGLAVDGETGCNVPLIGQIMTGTYNGEYLETNAIELQISGCYNTAHGDYAFIGKEFNSDGDPEYTELELTTVNGYNYYSNAADDSAIVDKEVGAALGEKYTWFDKEKVITVTRVSAFETLCSSIEYESEYTYTPREGATSYGPEEYHPLELKKQQE